MSTTEDFRKSFICRCLGCGEWGDKVSWARIGSGYENGHIIDGSTPDICGPMVFLQDYDEWQGMAHVKHSLAEELIAFRRAAEARFTDVIDLLRHGVGG